MMSKTTSTQLFDSITDMANVAQAYAAEMRAQTSAITKDRDEWKAKAEALTTERTRLQARVAMLKKYGDDLMVSLGESEKAAIRWRSAFDDAEKSTAQVQARLDSMTTARDEWRSKAQARYAEIDRHRVRNDKIAEERDNLRAELEALKVKQAQFAALLKSFSS